MLRRLAVMALAGLGSFAQAAEVDTSPLPLKPTLAFPGLKWTDWEPLTEDGELMPIRPIVLTHAGDGSDRVFVATQRGVIHFFKKEPAPTKTTVFLDMQEKVVYNDKQNEEGFLGLAFHPKYAENGQFFVYYTTTEKPHVSIVSRMRVDPKDPNRADADFEEEILRIEQPFWNHNGGTICFGPDGYLYIALGDGGSANDPLENGQNLGTWLGSILRIDVDRKEGGLPYAVPADNPFVEKGNAEPEIYAYGVRNPWRLTFDRKTGQGWFGDVGQKLWEEIDLLEKGANYGWNLREGMHAFPPGRTSDEPVPGLVEPIWEYHHDVGKSITGGHVYRGSKLPELVGAYIYADYVSGDIWALRYDFDEKVVTENRSIPDRDTPVLSFGEDQDGEIYFLTYSQSGDGIYTFERTKD